MHRFILLLTLVLAACGPSGTSVYDKNDNRVGNVSVSDANNATVYSRDEYTAGKVRVNDVYDKNDNRVGKIRADDTIEDKNGNRVGKLRDGKSCVDKNDNTVGRITEQIDEQAAGGACLLLLLVY